MVNYCAPGDRREVDVWILRFEDPSLRECVFEGPDAELEARRAWERHCGPSGHFNGYLFRLASRL